ncbi:MAG: histidine kinase [Bacillales bacterium]|jgi:two-component system sporulation sensor kinase B|nr:histidine kinase [Bacillales bacterium]
MISLDFVLLLVFNIFIIIFSLFIFQLFVYETVNDRKRKSFILLLLCTIVMLLCIIYPIKLHNDDFIFDLRQIPLIIAILYGGRRIGITLFVILVLFRTYLGGLGAIVSFFENGTLLIFLIYFINYYRFTNLNKKLIFIGLTSVLTLILPIMYYFIIVGTQDAFAFILMQFYLSILQTLILLLSIYFIEVMISNKKLREKLVHSEKTEMISHLAASISHEIRNPLTVSKGFVQLIKELDPEDPDRDEYFKHALDELDRANSIITNYLSYAKPSIEKANLFEVNEQLSSIIQIIKPYANLYSVVVVNKSDTKFDINGDSDKFKQIFINIIKNSIEAMKTGGILTIETIANNNIINIIIKDVGQGMTNEQIRRLGQPYFSTKEKGTGLGLMVAYSLVKAMNGTIRVESQLNIGTTFIVSFPNNKN